MDVAVGALPDGERILTWQQLYDLSELPQRLMPGTATTIGVVATDALLDKAQAHKLAMLGHAGLARAVDPLTMHDGDTLFALATGHAGRRADLSLLGALAARVVAEAIRSGVRAAQRG